MMGEAWLRKRFIRLHGIGADNQADVYHCQSCGKLVTWNKIGVADLCCQGRLVPASPTTWEAIKLLVFPWLV